MPENRRFSGLFAYGAIIQTAGAVTLEIRPDMTKILTECTKHGIIILLCKQNLQERSVMNDA